MKRIKPLNTENIRVLVANNHQDCIELVNIALKNRLYVSGWQLSHTMKKIRKNYNNETISIVYYGDLPVSVSIQDKISRVQSFTKKDYRFKGFGRIAIECLMEHRNNDYYFNEHGVDGSWSFFDKTLTMDKNFDEVYLYE